MDVDQTNTFDESGEAEKKNSYRMQKVSMDIRLNRKQRRAQKSLLRKSKYDGRGNRRNLPEMV